MKHIHNQTPPIPLGTETPHGTVYAVMYKRGERDYLLLHDGVVALLPASIVEESVTEEPADDPR